jgi:hypothetical protein
MKDNSFSHFIGLFTLVDISCFVAKFTDGMPVENETKKLNGFSYFQLVVAIDDVVKRKPTSVSILF